MSDAPGIFDGDPRAAESQELELAGSRPEGLHSLARRFHGQRADVASGLVPVGASREEAERPRRAVAARLTSEQRLRDLDPLWQTMPEQLLDPAVEMRACLLGELALLGTGRGRPALDAYAERLRELGHPLTRLPGIRLDVEHRFMVRARGGGPVRTPDQSRSRLPEIPPTEGGAAAARTAVETADAPRDAG